MGRLLFELHPGNGRALYRQIVEQVKAAIATGRLGPGDRLPAHRELARELVIAPLTVKKAYDVVQSQGLISMRQGIGTFVVAASAAAVPEAEQELDECLRGLVMQARLMGLS